MSMNAASSDTFELAATADGLRIRPTGQAFLLGTLELQHAPGWDPNTSTVTGGTWQRVPSGSAPHAIPNGTRMRRTGDTMIQIAGASKRLKLGRCELVPG